VAKITRPEESKVLAQRPCRERMYPSALNRAGPELTEASPVAVIVACHSTVQTMPMSATGIPIDVDPVPPRRSSIMLEVMSQKRLRGSVINIYIPIQIAWGKVELLSSTSLKLERT
jgi:hypothetical protein